VCVPSQLILLTGVTIGVVIRLRTGDKAIIIGALEIWAYEKFVSDDEDLISRRVAAYRTRPAGRLLTDAVILATALHLAEYVVPEWDVYHHAMKWVRRNVGGQK
jgi:predicted nucleic acid-binding protein